MARLTMNRLSSDILKGLKPVARRSENTSPSERFRHPGNKEPATSSAEPLAPPADGTQPRPKQLRHDSVRASPQHRVAHSHKPIHLRVNDECNPTANPMML